MISQRMQKENNTPTEKKPTKKKTGICKQRYVQGN